MSAIRNARGDDPAPTQSNYASQNNNGNSYQSSDSRNNHNNTNDNYGGGIPKPRGAPKAGFISVSKIISGQRY